jgi:hypothetical protein
MKVKRFHIRDSFERRYRTENMTDRDQAEGRVCFWVFAVTANERHCSRLDCGRIPGEVADELLSEAEREGEILIRERWRSTVEQFESTDGKARYVQDALFG